ncbi:hypothetical protein PROFUN_11492 [Planoprotostelium fungivorum]|uniref:Single-stranded DNA binding protein Ssb-like OB fold domain-containing protein n=1 Tax=Planoprotostelium fungivorum TaxID=1890364 RepID=A0A2P6N9Y7_9EUKA|nr:hypothetical protein PROFUN_11492 [Planoprotostelium fungivorum]
MQQPQNAEQSIKKRPAIFTQVSQVKPSKCGYNLKLKVLYLNNVLEKTRIDGTTVRIAECIVGDESGSIILTARNDQIDKVQPGKSIIVRNSKIDMFKGFMRLAVDKWGKIENSPEAFHFQVNANNNLSHIEYELVSVEE